MMTELQQSRIHFDKYTAAGNDFIIIDNTRGQCEFLLGNRNLILLLCTRRFGIGADGLLLLCSREDFNFEIVYHNSDGLVGRLCGNGMRSALSYSIRHRLVPNPADINFLAHDGAHRGHMTGSGQIFASIRDVDRVVAYDKMSSINPFNDAQVTDGQKHFYVEVGSLHHVILTKNLDQIDIIDVALKIRKEKLYEKQNGELNVMFVEENVDGEIRARAFENGVNDETMACGTGAVAISLAMAYQDKQLNANHDGCQINKSVKFPGGNLDVDFKFYPPSKFTDILLTGPTEFVFQGIYQLNENLN